MRECGVRSDTSSTASGPPSPQGEGVEVRASGLLRDNAGIVSYGQRVWWREALMSSYKNKRSEEIGI